MSNGLCTDYEVIQVETEENEGLGAQMSRRSPQRRLRGWRVLRSSVGEVTFSRGDSVRHVTPPSGTREVGTPIPVRGSQGGRSGQPGLGARRSGAQERGSESGNPRGPEGTGATESTGAPCPSGAFLPPGARASPASTYRKRGENADPGSFPLPRKRSRGSPRVRAFHWPQLPPAPTRFRSRLRGRSLP